MNEDLTLEKLEINKRLGSLEVLVATVKARIESEFGGLGTQGNLYRIFDETTKQIDEIKDIISDREYVTLSEFSRHITMDKWMFGLLITMNIGILLKLFFG